MIKTNQFSAKTPYVTPWCKCAELAASARYMNVASPNYKDNGLVDIDGEDVEDQTNDWGLGL